MRPTILALTGLLLVPAAASADKRAEAAASNRFTTPQVTIDQGERLTFRNTDVATHDFTAQTRGADGKPLFSTPLLGQNEEAFVEGSQYLTTGEYAFLCTVHPQMQGRVTVTGAGTPVPRPGGAGTTAPATQDEDAPGIAVVLSTRRLSSARANGALVARVRVTERAKVLLKARARPRPGGPLVTVAQTSISLPAAGLRNVELQLTKAGRAAIKGRRKLVVVLTARAVDPAGNAASEVHGRTLRS